jgi:hypothetical protein
VRCFFSRRSRRHQKAKGSCIWTITNSHAISSRAGDSFEEFAIAKKKHLALLLGAAQLLDRHERLKKRG